MKKRVSHTYEKKTFCRRVFGGVFSKGFWRGVPEGLLEGCSWMEKGFRRSQKGALPGFLKYEWSMFL